MTVGLPFHLFNGEDAFTRVREAFRVSEKETQRDGGREKMNRRERKRMRK